MTASHASLSSAAESRTALLAGATGLVGRALWPLLADAARYRRLEVLARRPLPDVVADSPTVTVRVVDFADPAAVPPVDDVYIALGTTIKIAGSQAAFRAVDLDLVVAIARAARARGATGLAVVSALGADPRSRVFYNRVKGEMEAAVGSLGYDCVAIARPSLLLGDRAALGQPVRAFEALAARLFGPLAVLVPPGVRPIQAGDVACALVDALTIERRPGLQVLSSAQMQKASPRR